MVKTLSICCGMGLMDRAFLDAGFDVTPGCEIDIGQRDLYEKLCGKLPLYADLFDMVQALKADRKTYAGIFGGPPCQSLSRTKGVRKPMWRDMTDLVVDLLEVCKPEWYLFENVRSLPIPGSECCALQAALYYKPHQSRIRWFTYSPNLVPPMPVYSGTVDDLLAYPAVVGKLYGPKRAAAIQGYPEAANLKGNCEQLQRGLAEAVPYPLALAWAERVSATHERKGNHYGSKHQG